MELLSVPTILICTFITMSSASLAMWVVWLYNRQERAAGYWALGFLLGALGGMSVALRGVFPEYVNYAIITHSLLVSTAYIFVWGGFRAFNRQSVPGLALFAVPALWLMAYMFWQPLRDDANIGIATQSAIISGISFLSAYTVYTGPGNRRLPMAIPLTVFLATHGTMHLGHIWFAIYDPSPVVAGRMTAIWWKIFMLEAFLHTVLTAISCIILIKDRSEERHRIASETDSLTGIANRRAFVKDTVRQLATANESAALAIIDLDHFKQINDQYGHQAGDYALITFANLIRNNIPEGAHLGRLGGEEFALYLPQSADRPQDTLEMLRQKVEELPIIYQGTRIQLTASIGFTTVEKAGNGFDLLVAAADCALYLAKDEGRNRVLAFAPSQRLRKIREKDGEKRVGLANERISRKTARPNRAQA